MTVPPLLAGLLDDAALFPPGNVPPGTAVAAHVAHRRSAHRDLVGPFVVPAPRLGELPAVQVDPLTVSVTVSAGTVRDTLARVRDLDGITLAALEVAIPETIALGDVLHELQDNDADTAGVDIYLEIPRSDRGPSVLAALSGTRYAAKFRTGGVVASAYPDEAELATAIHTAVTLEVPFKATAGLHRAVRNTDPVTRFEQHGFLDVLWATHLAADGSDVDDVAAALAIRDGARLVGGLSRLTSEAVARIRASFRSFGTCSITEPLADLAVLGLPVTGEEARG
ncbi:hypothetical protein [Prescottella subtropica]|uniref:hypothetical protein n=1 Tax=Prescottella subtropica TaxID=2545757 RepID=UPI0010F8E98B|nr:hypothetical protein [Prescottella subtropica]